MTKDLQKLREEFWLERFREQSGLAFQIDDDRENRERPDFLVRHDQRIIGVEVTELQLDRDRGNQNGSALHMEVELQQSVVRRAQQIYFSEDGIPLNAQISFEGGPSQSLQRLNRKSIAEAIAKLLRRVSIAPLEQRRLDSQSELAPPEPVGSIMVRGLPDSITPHWQLTRSAWSKAFEASDVESILAAKNALHGEYCATVLENWLLIVADGSKPSGMFRAPVAQTIDLPSSEFDKTFFLCEPSRFLIEWSRSGRCSSTINR